MKKTSKLAQHTAGTSFTLNRTSILQDLEIVTRHAQAITLIDHHATWQDVARVAQLAAELREVADRIACRGEYANTQATQDATIGFIAKLSAAANQ